MPIYCQCDQEISVISENHRRTASRALWTFL